MKTQVIEAVYRDGVLHPAEPLDLKQDARVRIYIKEPAPDGSQVDPKQTKTPNGAALMKFFGCVKPSGEDPVAMQRRMREEWDEREKERLSVADQTSRP